MMKFFYLGGPFFMGILTLLLTALIVFAIIAFRQINKHGIRTSYLPKIKSIGLLALVVGILGQLIGLYSGFSTIEHSGNVSPEILASGIKISLITTIFGLIIFLVCRVLVLFLDWFGGKNSEES